MRLGLVAATAACTLWATAALAVPAAIPYVGSLTFDSGAPYNGTVSAVVRMLDASSGGAVIWGPVDLGQVSVIDGSFSVLLGAAGQTPLPPVITTHDEVWLEWTLAGQPMAPLQRLYSVPYALRAGDSEALGGVGPESFTTQADLADYVPKAPVSAVAPSNPEEGWLWVDTGTGILNVYRGGAWEPATTDPSSASGDFEVADDLTVGGSISAGGAVYVGAEAGACTAALEGGLRYNSTTKQLEVCNGVAWTATWQSFPGSTSFNPGASCKAIRDQTPSISSGIYWIDTTGGDTSDSYRAYCDMATASGGWTLTLNLDTSDGHVMWWANALWTNSATYGDVLSPFDGDHKSRAWSELGGATEILLVVHQQGSIVGWKRFSKTNAQTMSQHLAGGDNTLIGSAVLSSFTTNLSATERLVRISSSLYANHCVASGGGCTSGSSGSPDGDRIGSHEGTPSDNNGGGLGNWHDMNYCCSGSFGSGKTCNGFAFRTVSEAQGTWCGGGGYFGTDTYAPASCTQSNGACGTAEWAGASGIAYDYSLFLR